MPESKRSTCVLLLIALVLLFTLILPAIKILEITHQTSSVKKLEQAGFRIEYFSEGNAVFAILDSHRKPRSVSTPGILLALSRIGSSGIREVDVSCLREINAIGSLEELDLGLANVSDEDLALLNELPDLRTLRVGCTQITDKSVPLICRLGPIETLTLNATQVSDACVSELLNLKSLQILEVWNTNISPASIQKFRNAGIRVNSGPDPAELFRDWASFSRVLPDIRDENDKESVDSNAGGDVR